MRGPVEGPFLEYIMKIGTLLIAAEGTGSSKVHLHFLFAVFTQGRLFNVLREKRVIGRPCRLSA
ncbi:hypothetical protein DFO73_109238 [Cytobacillus oceanisediminis]|jgi:hypothetical protein|uniref:Uncharacterized protein n=1 Tax=Cytobacillus oceanisediminis TaxID=665099 RepID=A0A2V2ZSM9_9BACI|nr:hypothetical protein DFO73_109238 [Cytobacillus oceanisediminis]